MQKRHHHLVYVYLTTCLLLMSLSTVSAATPRLYRRDSCSNNGGSCTDPNAPCCSAYGYCGSGDAYCGNGCVPGASLGGTCGGTSSPPPPPPPPTGNGQLSQCLTGLDGTVVYPQDSAYSADIQDENKAKTYNPAAILYANSNNDIKIAINCASKLNIGITARSGGHSYESYSLGGKDGVLVVDLTDLNQITIDSQAKTATIGTGNRLGQIYSKLNDAGYLVPGGSCPGVGIGGHALGGGFGLYSRKYGLASDNVISAEIVLANGETVTADATNNPDLFFALRGAGAGSYGIVTNLQFKLNQIPPVVTTFQYRWGPGSAHQLIPAITQFSISGTPDVTFSLVWSLQEFVLQGVYIGPQTNIANALNTILSVAPTTGATVIQQSFIESVTYFGGNIPLQNPYRNPYFFKAKSFFVGTNGLSSEGIDTFNQFLVSSPSSCAVYAILDGFGGAINTIPSDQTAFVHRNISFGIQLVSSWGGQTQTADCTNNLNTFSEPFRKTYTTEFSYQNYIDQDLPNWQNAYYGSNFNRLVSIKNKYDSTNLFQFPQSIPTQ